ncbi:hypothetical protein GGQ99_000959 [Aminobacter niigataensis]|uniref:Uncharacterized protein n=1 Tax=Aminobacter niigataensis TaxID=83265 RepID=A0ABR6KXJ1_9HYPH|nr:hypothetical protein [Aminobacter niigataensis]MBB4649237.1 hypothetical protein [Aminobacter niigataensis]
MPTVPDEYVPWQVPVAKPAAAAPEAPATMETVRAAGTLANYPYRSWRYLENREGAVTDPGHNPLEMIRGTKYEADPERFAYARNEQETRSIMQEWDDDEQAADVLGRSGRKGMVAAVGMGLVDPTIFLPIAKVFTGAAAGYRALRIGADVALASGASAAIGETAMAVTTPHYGADDVAVGIGTATILGGFLGAGAGALLSRAERNTIVKALDADRVEIPSSPQAVGAAAADTRQLELDSAPLLDKLPDPTAKISPPRRVLNSPFIAARRATVDLVETPYLFKENREGVATTQGPALDRLAKNEVNKARVGLARMIDSAYARYRFGGEAENWRQSLSQRGARLMDHTGRPSEKVSQPEFRAMVDEALRNGDQHPVQEAAEVAKFLRNTILNPWRDRAIKAGLLPEDVDVATADSYMIRVWNKQRLIGERPRAVQVFSDWLEGEEAKKAALQDQLRDLQGKLDTVGANIVKLEKAKVKKLGHDAELIDLAGMRDRLLAKVEETLGQWQGKSAKAVKAALKGRATDETARAEKIAAGTYAGKTFNGKPDRLQSADTEIASAVQHILSKERLRTRQEIEGVANEIVDRIVGNPDGRLPYDAHTAPRESGPVKEARGPLAARDFMIPDNLVREFLDTDAQNTAEIYLNTMVPDVLLTERFGDADMTEAFRQIKDEAAALQMGAKTPAEREKIKTGYDSTVADLAAMRDRVRHTYGYSSDPRQRFMGRMAMAAARYDVMTNLGGAALSSVADIAGVQWRYGLTRTFRGAWLPFAKSLANPETRKAVVAWKGQLQALGIAAETYLNSRAASLHDVLDIYRPTSRVERGVKVGADVFQNVSGLAQWTDFSKLAAGMVAGTELTRAAEALSVGKATAKQIRDLAENGIDAAMAGRIEAALKADGGSDVIDGMRIPNTGNWTDAGAREAFEGALARDVDVMIITPGAEKPLMMSNPIAALILQYKSFVTAAHERLLVRSLQTRDINVLHGAVSAIGLGILAEYAYSAIVGRDMPKEPGDLIKAGMTRSGMLGWYQEANALSEKWFSLDAFSAVGAKRPDSRYISRESLTAALGPTAGKIEALIKSGRNTANLDWSAGDTRRMRRMLIGQNLFYIRTLLDKLEAGVNEAVGIEPLRGQ